MVDGIVPTPEPDRLPELRGSAKGWHGIQLAALGFVGLCGVLQSGDASGPQTLQVLSGILVLVALVLACLGIYLVGRAAWPLYGGGPPSAEGDEAALERTSRQLRSGLVMTFASVGVLALATTASWWPVPEGSDGAVQVQAGDGQSWCGRLAEAPQAGALRVVTASEDVLVGLDTLASVRPIDSC